MVAAGVVYILGDLLFGIATFRAGILSRWAAGLFGLGAVSSPAFALLPQSLEPLAAVPVGLGLAWLGYSLWSERREAGVNAHLPSSAPSSAQPQPRKFARSSIERASGRILACLTLSPAPRQNCETQHRSFNRETNMPITQPATVRRPRVAAIVRIAP